MRGAFECFGLRTGLAKTMMLVYMDAGVFMLKKEVHPWFWFLGGLFAGLTLIGASHAAVIREMDGGKARVPTHLEREFESLNRVEGKFVESPEQVSRLRKNSLRASGQVKNVKKTGVIR